MELFVAAVFLAVANQKIVDYLFAPAKRRYPDIDFWWLLYVALATGAIIGWFSQINLFELYIPDAFIGRLLTAILIGGGSSLIHDIFDEQAEVVLTAPLDISGIADD